MAGWSLPEVDFRSKGLMFSMGSGPKGKTWLAVEAAVAEQLPGWRVLEVKAGAVGALLDAPDGERWRFIVPQEDSPESRAQALVDLIRRSTP